jgi:hypothetical protein
MGILDEIQKELRTAPRKRSAVVGAGKRRPTQVERMLLIAAAAQLIAGPRKNPTRAQLARATRAVDARIAKETAVSGRGQSDVVGGFWDNVKNLAKSAGNAAVRAAPAVFGFVTKNPQILLPLAGAAVASPFLIRAISAASASPQAQQEAAAGPPPPPPDAVPVTNITAPTNEAEDVLGVHHSWDDTVVGEITEEEAALAGSGGATERESMERLRGTSVMGASSAMGAGEVHHDHYRAAVMVKAAELAKGKKPSTKDFYLAKKLMDRRLQRKRLKVAIPGARPGRRTR